LEVGDLSSRQIEPDQAVSVFFRTMASANKASKAAVVELLAKLNT
jgi:hypothetical protein